MSLEDDLRHTERNTEARQRSIDALMPVLRECLMLIMEMDDKQLRAWRDDVRDRMTAKERRSERVNFGVMELAKWLVAGIGGAAATWFGTHWKS